MNTLTSAADLADPSTWCDSRCERCPVLDQCRVGRRLMRRRRTDAPEDPIADVIAPAYEASAAILRHQLESRGIDPDQLGPSEPCGDSKLAAFLGTDLVYAAEKFVRSARRGGAPVDDPALAELLANACLVAAKTVRLSCQKGTCTLGQDLDDPAEEPIALLIERAGEAIDEAIQRLGRYARAAPRTYLKESKDGLWQLVGSWIDGVSAETRAAIEALVDAEAAPSPFCQIQIDRHRRRARRS